MIQDSVRPAWTALAFPVSFLRLGEWNCNLKVVYLFRGRFEPNLTTSAEQRRSGRYAFSLVARPGITLRWLTGLAGL